MAVSPKDILEQFWGYNDFRSPQQEIIQSILDGRDTFAMLPTGGGKSITFQVPALLSDGICLVISPLIALMKDQTKNLKEKEIKAAYISSEIPYSDIQIILDNCRFGGIKLLYVSPERMQSANFLAALQTLNVSFIAIDEAHCISEWGHDFRPSYLALKNIREILPEKPILALTATATPYIEQEILKELALENPNIFKKSLERKNLAYRIQPAEDKLQELVHILRQFPGSTIVFCRTRKQTYEISTFLQEKGLDADFFHAGLPPEDKSFKQKAFIQSSDKILCSTNAFGMGIDKPDVRNVIHLSPPASIESYFQEAGRGGRDGLPARGILLYNPEDKKNAFKMFRSNLPKKPEFLKIILALYNDFQIADHEQAQGQMGFSERKFAEQNQFSLQKVKNVLQFMVQQELIVIHRSQRQSLVKILIENRNFQDENNTRGKVLSYLARNYAGIFKEPQSVDEALIARHLQIPVMTVKEKLKEMHDSETLFYRDAAIIKISFSEPRDDRQARVELYRKFEQLQRVKWQRLNAMYFYAEDENQCKSRMLLHYFGEKKSANCGICSYCQKLHSTQKTTAEEILQFLHSGEKRGDEIFSYFSASDKKQIVQILQELLDEDKIKFNLPNNYAV